MLFAGANGRGEIAPANRIAADHKKRRIAEIVSGGGDASGSTEGCFFAKVGECYAFGFAPEMALQLVSQIAGGYGGFLDAMLL